MSLIIHQFINPPLKNNNYLVADETTREAILIDCSCAENSMLQWAEQHDFQIKYILLTHGHFDHVLGVNHYLANYNIPAYLYEKDLNLLDRINEYTQFFSIGIFTPMMISTFNLRCSLKSYILF